MDPVAGRRLLDARLHVGGGGAGGRLADRDGRLLALQHPRKPPPLLRLAAVRVEGADRPQISLDHDAPGDAARARDLLDDEDHVEQRPAPAAEGLGDGHPHEAGGREVLHVLPRVFLAGVPARGALGERAVGELACPPAQLLLLGGQLEVHGGKSTRDAAVVRRALRAPALPAQSGSGGGREERGEAVRRPSEGAVEAPSENQMWIAWPRAASVASSAASESVGCAWMVCIISSSVASSVRPTANSWIISVA